MLAFITYNFITGYSYGIIYIYIYSIKWGSSVLRTGILGYTCMNLLYIPSSHHFSLFNDHFPMVSRDAFHGAASSLAR